MKDQTGWSGDFSNHREFFCMAESHAIRVRAFLQECKKCRCSEVSGLMGDARTLAETIEQLCVYGRQCSAVEAIDVRELVEQFVDQLAVTLVSLSHSDVGA